LSVVPFSTFSPNEIPLTNSCIRLRGSGDSRTPHYNVSPTGEQERLAAYTCYMPVEEASQEDLRRKEDAFQRRVGTTHWPNAKHTGSNVAVINRATGEVHPGPARDQPINPPELSERAFKLTGIPYLKQGVIA
jgi:hypothetical protein